MHTGKTVLAYKYMRKRPVCEVIDLVRFLRETVKPERDDLLVLKIDVEGSEYSLIDHLRAHEMLELIDEVFIEMHFSHPQMNVHGWSTFRKSRDEARELLVGLRADGVYAHSWP